MAVFSDIDTRLDLAFPMFLGLVFIWSTLNMPHFVRLLKALVKRKS